MAQLSRSSATQLCRLLLMGFTIERHTCTTRTWPPELSIACLWMRIPDYHSDQQKLLPPRLLAQTISRLPLGLNMKRISSISNKTTFSKSTPKPASASLQQEY